MKMQYFKPLILSPVFSLVVNWKNSSTIKTLKLSAIWPYFKPLRQEGSVCSVLCLYTSIVAFPLIQPAETASESAVWPLRITGKATHQCTVYEQLINRGKQSSFLKLRSSLGSCRVAMVSTHAGFISLPLQWDEEFILAYMLAGLFSEF